MLKILFILPVIGSLCAMAQDTQGNTGAPISGEVLSSNIEIYPSPNVHPHKKGQVTVSGFFHRPTGNADTTQKLPCRPAAPNQDTTLQILDWIESQIGHSLDTSSIQDVSPDEPPSVSVSRNWLKLGLLIINKNVEKDKNYTLLIDHITFSAQREFKGQIFNYAKTIRPDYCGLPFLYLVQPGPILDYKPFSENPLENLTLYVDNFPFIDNSNEASSAEGVPKIIIPEYEILFTLRGQFILEGTPPIPFITRRQFSTSQALFYN